MLNILGINANNYPTYFQSGAVWEPLFLPPDGSTTRFPIGWRGLGRYTAGTLRIWCDGVALAAGTDYTEEGNGVFFNFTTPPPSGNKYYDYMVVYVPRAADVMFATGADGGDGDEMFLFPNWLGSTYIGDAFWMGRHLASHADATASAVGSSTTPVSVPGVVPWHSVTFTNADTYTKAKGAKFHVVNNREWCNVAMWCKLMDIYPTGNSVSGVDGMGVAHTADPTQAGRALTSTGPVTSSHNHTEYGIFDLVGNIWDWVDGLQLQGGVAYVMDSDGNLTTTGLTLSTGLTSGNAFSYLYSASHADEGLPKSAAGVAIKGADCFWYTNSGTMQAARGGYWGPGALDGLFALLLNAAPSSSYTHIGFRPACSL